MPWRQVVLTNVLSVTVQGTPEAEVKVEASAWDKTLRRSHLQSPLPSGGHVLPLQVIEQGVCLRTWSQLPPVLLSPTSSPTRPHGAAPLLLWMLSYSTQDLHEVWPVPVTTLGVCVCSWWKPNAFQNRRPFVGFPVYCLEKDNTIMFECLMKVSVKFAIIVTVLFSLCSVRWLLRKLKLAPKMRFWKGLTEGLHRKLCLVICYRWWVLSACSSFFLVHVSRQFCLSWWWRSHAV